MMFNGYGYGWGGMGWGLFGMLLFWGLLAVGIGLLIRFVAGIADRRPPKRAGKSAQDILAERYARGEIGREEFEQKRRDLASLAPDQASKKSP